MKSVLLIVLIATSLAACSQKGPCDPEKVEAFFTLPKDKALGGARFICKYPATLQTMLDNLDMVSPDQRAMMVAKAVSQDISRFQRVCPKAAKVFQIVAAVAADQKTTVLIEGCGLNRLGLANRSEMVDADMVNLLVAVMLYGWMQDEKVPQAREICRFILGLQG